MEVHLAPAFAELSRLVLVHAGIFARIGAALAVLPGLGDRAVPMRVKLALALAITVLLAPMVASVAGPAPRTPLGLVGLLGTEAAAGLVIGLAFRFLVFALQIAGSIASQSVSIAHVFGNTMSQEAEPTIATFLVMGGVVLAMMAGLHVALVVALAGLYDLLPFGRPVSGAVLSDWGVGQVGRVFALGLSLALPFVMVSFAYNLALGALSRAMPQLLVALVGAPLLVGLGMGVLWLALPEIMASWMAVVARVFDAPLGGLP